MSVALALIVSGIDVRSAAAESSAAVVSADVQSIVRQLAAAIESDPIASCADNGRASSPFPMLAASPGAAPGLPPGPPSPAVGLWAMCALPYVSGANGGDCNGKHRVQYQTFGASGNAKVTVEMLGLDADGMLIDSLPVRQGDVVHLASRLSPDDWKFQQGKKESQVFAPVPLLKVTVEDEGQKAEAYCSNIPWLDVLQPSGGVATESNGGAIDVLAAAPQTDPQAVQLLIDGDDLLDDVPDPLACSHLAPCNGTADINGQMVTYTNLIVDVASNLTQLASNTIRATLSGLSCGGHFARATTVKLPGTLRRPGTDQCVIDDLTDKGGFSIFDISIDSPLPNENVLTAPPWPVVGLVCSGTEIVDVNVNGKTLSLAGQVVVPGDGETVGDAYTVEINTTLGESDLVSELVTNVGGASSLGTFDAGSNRLVASAREITGTRAYERLIFATGPVAPIGVAAGATIVGDPNSQLFRQAALESRVASHLQQLLQPVVAETTTELQNAFIVGLSASGTQTLFNELCTTPVLFEGAMLTPGQIFQQEVSAAVHALDDGGIVITPPVDCSGDPNVAITISNVTVGNAITCSVAFQDGSFQVTMNLPDIHVDISAYGEGGDWGDDVCVAGVRVQGSAFADVTGINLQFEVTEDNLLHNTFSSANFNAGATVENQGSIDVDFCGLSVLCEVLLEIFTLGSIDLDNLDFGFVEDLDFQEAVRANQPDPVRLREIKVDEQVVANFDQQLSGVVSEVHITPGGISAGLRGSFATMAIDAGVESTPGITLTPAPVPTMETMTPQGALDALVGLSDDSINMMFASLTAAGNFKAGTADEQGCFDTGSDIGSLLPANCDDLSLGDDLATSTARGYCHAIRGASCDALNYVAADPNLSGFFTSTERGVCHGAQGHNCVDTAGGDLVKWGACSITPNFNLHADQSLLFCAQAAVPPRMLFPGAGASGGAVPTALRVNDLTVSLVIDRTGNSLVNTPLGTTPGCFDSATTTADCNLFAACLDLNLNFSMQFLNSCPDDRPGFKSTFDSIQILNRDVGVVCSGTTSPASDDDILDTADDDVITIPIATNAAQLSPDICGAGLDLGGFVQCDSPTLLTLEADGSPELRDYLAISCAIAP